MERVGDPSDLSCWMSAALESRETRAAELLVAHWAVLSAAQEPEARRPVFERLRDLLGPDLTRLLVFGLTRAQRARWPRLPLEERGPAAP